MGFSEHSGDGLPDKFLRATVLGQPKQAVTLELDADLLLWLETEPGGIQSQVNDLLRFWKDTSQAKDAEFESQAWELSETVPAL